VILLMVAVLAQVKIELGEYRSSYLVWTPEAYSDRGLWPAILDLGDPKVPLREPGALVLAPEGRDDEALALACLLDAKSKYRIHPERVIVRGAAAALSAGASHPELFAGVALEGSRSIWPVRKSPPLVLFLSKGDSEGVRDLAALMVMKKAGGEAQVRAWASAPGEVLAALDPQIHPKGDMPQADAWERSGRYLDASLLLMDLAEAPDVGRLARTKLRAIEGAAIVELAKVELAMADRKYKDAILRCRSAARQFAWVPQGPRIQKRLGELESRPEVQKALELPD
jgi:hypothetical protein